MPETWVPVKQGHLLMGTLLLQAGGYRLEVVQEIGQLEAWVRAYWQVRVVVLSVKFSEFTAPLFEYLARSVFDKPEHLCGHQRLPVVGYHNHMVVETGKTVIQSFDACFFHDH